MTVPAVTNPERLPHLRIYDADGNELVTAWWALNQQPPDRRPPHERINDLPPPAGHIGTTPLWYRHHIEPATLFDLAQTA